MDAEFARVVSAWRDFYSLAGSASASLVGLLFVAASIHLSKVASTEATHLLSFASNTFSGFLYVLLISLLMLIPGQSSSTLGIELMGLGVITTVRQIQYTTRHYVGGDPHHPVYVGDRGRLYQAVLPTICYASMVWVGWLVNSSGSPRPLAFLVSTVVLLLIAGARNSWRLLIELAKAHQA